MKSKSDEREAALERENAELRRQLAESLAQQTATAEVLGVINASPGDPAPVFEAILEKAHTLCGANHGTLCIREGDLYPVVAIRGVPEPFATQLRHSLGPDAPAIGHLLAGNPYLHIPDMTKFDHSMARVAEAAGVRTLLSVPLLKDGLVGAIMAARYHEVRPFSDQEIALLQNFAAQAVIAMENARLITETREALEQQTATAEVLGVINSSPGDLAPVFEAILDKALTVCEAAFGSFTLLEGALLRAVVHRGVPDELIAALGNPISWPPFPGGHLHRIATGELVVPIADFADTDAYRNGMSWAVPLVDNGGARTAIWVALRKEEALLGVLVIYRREVRPFTDRQIALLQNFAAQAVIAIENARLITETREALEQQTATAEVLGVINSSPGDLAPVFDAILEKAHTLCGAERGSLQLYDGKTVRAVATRETPGPLDTLLRQPHQPAPAFSRLVAGERFYQFADESGIDPLYRSSSAISAIATKSGIRTLLFVPLRKDASLIGVISAARLDVRPFSEKEIVLLENFAAQAVIAMENARLLTETREALDQQTATAEVLQVINSSPGELAPVFDAMLEKAVRLCEATYGTMFTQDGDRFRAVALRDVPEKLAEFLQRESLPLGPNTFVGRVMRERSPLHIADITMEEPYRQRLPIAVAGVEFGGGRTMLTVPLFKNDALLGIFQLVRQEVRPFSEKQIALVQNFAAQAVIAMENARLITETREALEQQTATAEVLQVINASPGDLAPVFDAILEKARLACGAPHGDLWTRDGDVLQLAATHGEPGFAEWLRQHPTTPLWKGSPPERVVLGEEYVQFDDAREDASFRLVPEFLEQLERTGLRSTLLVPLRKEDEVLGVIVVYRREVRRFTDKQIALLQNFAAQAVIAMENARLITETHEALDQQTATAEVLQVINASPGELTPVFDAMLEKAMRLCEAQFGFLSTYDGEHFDAVALHGLPESYTEQYLTGPYLPGPNTTHDRLVSGELVVHVPDLAADMADSPRRRAVVDILGVRSILAVPLRKDDALLGAFHAYRQEMRPFTDKQIALLQNFAAQAVIAMENARLITETREALEQQTATAEVLGVINSSPGDLAPVFDAMLEKALRLSGGAFGNLLSYDGEFFKVEAAVHRDGGIADEMVQRPPFRAVPGGAPASMAEGQDILFTGDLKKSPDYLGGYSEFRRMVDRTGYQTVLNVALRREGVLLGTIGIFRTEVQPFTDKQIALLQNFAAQAVIAMENARLLTATQEALEQQTATAEVLQIINSSPGELQPVFDAILEQAHSLCSAAFGSLQIYDGENLALAASRGNPPELVEILLRPMRPSGAIRALIDGERLHEITDLREFVAQSGQPHPRQKATADAGIRTILYLPLRKEGAFFGMIVAARREVRSFSEKEITLLENFAQQAVIAMENARLLTETRERTLDLQESLEYQTAISEVLKVISQSTFDLQPVLDTLVATARGLCNADMAMIYRRQGDAYRLAANLGFPAEYEAFARNLSLTASRASVTQRAALERRISHVPDITADPEYALPEASQLGKARTALGVPLLREGEPVGVFTLARERVEPFTARQIELVRTFADQAVIAIENARLLGELRQRTEEVAELNRSLEARVAEQVDELGRVGRLKRFLAPQLAELIVSQGDEKILESHRREIVVVFCDLRGYTAFTETAEPEEVLDFLREYHGALGPLVAEFEGTLDQFSGDGIMVFFNDPVPIPDPAERAVKMAMAMREAAGALTAIWRRRGRELGFGAGIAQGYATLGQIGFSERSGYTAIGTVCNVAARLCGEAKDGQILIAQRVAAGLDGDIALEEIGPLPLKGITQPVAAFNVASDGAGAGRLRLVET